MALGIGLLMPPGADGRPMALYIGDLVASCPACGIEVARRYFLSTRFHSLTLPRLERLLLGLPAAIEGQCTQCDETLDSATVERWSLQFSPGDGDGLVIGLCDKDGFVEWRVSPHEFLDVQSVPVMHFDADDISSVRLTQLDEGSFFSAMGRFLNPKSAIRRSVLLAHDPNHASLPGARRNPDGSVTAEPAPGLTIWVGAAADQLRVQDSYPASMYGCVLVEDGEIMDGYPDAPAAWLSDLEPALTSRSVVAFASTDAVDASLRRHFQRFPVDISFVEAPDLLRVVAGDGSEQNSVLEFQLSALAVEAASSGAAPGDIARVEIDRALTLLDLDSR